MEKERKRGKKRIQPPDYMTSKLQIEKFNQYADMLLKSGLFTKLDVDCLARYIMSEQLYLMYTDLLGKMMLNDEDFDRIHKAQMLQDKAFRQCHTCAKALGLTITDRAKLIAPSPPEDDDDEL